MKKQQGFTLIELVMVIVILGILAATALPKFANLQSDARKSSLQGALGSVKSASAITHSASLIADSNTVTIEGTSYTLIFGYPATANIAELAGLSSTDYVLTTAGTVQLRANCLFTYAQPTVANTPPAISAITDTGC